MKREWLHHFIGKGRRCYCAAQYRYRECGKEKVIWSERNKTVFEVFYASEVDVR
jgi:hypothetical protein